MLEARIRPSRLDNRHVADTHAGLCFLKNMVGIKQRFLKSLPKPRNISRRFSFLQAEGAGPYLARRPKPAVKGFSGATGSTPCSASLRSHSSTVSPSVLALAFSVAAYSPENSIV